MSCDALQTHLDLIHFATDAIPVLVGGIPDADARCTAGEISMREAPGDKKVDLLDHECDARAWVELAFPAINEEGDLEMCVCNFCREHLALFIIASGDLVPAE